MKKMCVTSDEYFYVSVRYCLKYKHHRQHIPVACAQFPHRPIANAKHQQLTPNSIQTANTGPTTPNSLFINLHL